MWEEMDGKMFVSRHSWHYNFDWVIMLVLFPICTFTWHFCVALKEVPCFWEQIKDQTAGYHQHIFRSPILLKMLSDSSPGSVLRVFWLWEMVASGWGSHWESSSFVPWFVPNAFRVVSWVVPEWPCISGLWKKSSVATHLQRLLSTHTRA